MEATGDARCAMMSHPDETGAINVCDAKTVEISGNRLINNDYGIRVWGHGERADRVVISGNQVRDDHRSAFILVTRADGVEIHDNLLKDNGLSLFIDNEALVQAFAKGEDYGDGRASGIVTGGCSNVRTHGNTVINSNGDGILITLSTGISIHDNQIHHNGDGAIRWGKFFHPEADVFDGMDFKKGVAITSNNIHHNRVAVFGFLTDEFTDNVTVENNTFLQNGGSHSCEVLTRLIAGRPAILHRYARGHRLPKASWDDRSSVGIGQARKVRQQREKP